MCSLRKKTDISEIIAIDVVLKCYGDKLVSQKELAALISNVLPPYQMPSEINVVEALKRNASGKVIRIGK